MTADSLPPHGAVVPIAEDDPDVRDVLVMLLLDEGYRVATAFDGLDALAMARSEPHDVILVDAGLPRLDGAGFCRAYRKGGETAPVVLMSTATQETIEPCSAAAYTRRPFDVDDLLGTIARLVGDPLPGDG